MAQAPPARLLVRAVDLHMSGVVPKLADRATAQIRPGLARAVGVAAVVAAVVMKSVVLEVLVPRRALAVALDIAGVAL